MRAPQPPPIKCSCPLMRDIHGLVVAKKNKYVHKKSDRAWRIEPHLPKDLAGDSCSDIGRTRLHGLGLITSPALGGLFREMLVCSSGEAWWSCLSDSVRSRCVLHDRLLLRVRSWLLWCYCSCLEGHRMSETFKRGSEQCSGPHCSMGQRSLRSYHILPLEKLTLGTCTCCGHRRPAVTAACQLARSSIDNRYTAHRLKEDLELVRRQNGDAVALASCIPRLHFPERFENYKAYLVKLERKWIESLRSRGWTPPLDADCPALLTQHNPHVASGPSDHVSTVNSAFEAAAAGVAKELAQLRPQGIDGSPYRSAGALLGSSSSSAAARVGGGTAGHVGHLGRVQTAALPKRVSSSDLPAVEPWYACKGRVLQEVRLLLLAGIRGSLFMCSSNGRIMSNYVQNSARLSGWLP